MKDIYDQAAEDAVRFLLETGPGVWQTIPPRTITPEEFAWLAALEDEGRQRGVDVNFGAQTWITMRLELAIKTLTIRALEFEHWARACGRDDLVTPNADLAFEQG